MLLVFTEDRTWRFRSGAEHNDESRLLSLSPFMGLVFAAITMEGEVETESESLERLSLWLLKLHPNLFGLIMQKLHDKKKKFLKNMSKKIVHRFE